MHQDEFWTNWPWGIVKGLIENQGIYNNSGYAKYIKKIFDNSEGIKKKISVGTVDSKTGVYHVFNENDKEFSRKVAASGAIPFYFAN